jgi:chemotaxis protein CheD
MEQIVVGMADCRVAGDPEQVLATFALGSCIGLSIYDARARVGGLLHYMLPDSGIDSVRGRENPFMFADTGIPLLIEKVCSKGADRRQLIAHAAGGASIMDPNNVFDIGKRNHLALRKILWKAGVLLSGEAVGGTTSRTVRLEVGTGNLWIQEGCGPRELVTRWSRSVGSAPATPRPEAATRLASAPNTGTPPLWTQKGETSGLPGLNRR